MSLTSITLSDRICGSLFGLLICDSLGTAVEGQSPASFEPVKTLRGGGKFQLKPGQFTDDGSMALCLAVALLDDQADCLDIHPSVMQMNMYRRWYQEGYLSSNGECFDIGITVRTALNKFISDCDKSESMKLSNTPAYYGSRSNQASGNGSLMRLAPVPLLYHLNPDMAINEAVNSSKTTHASQLCLDSCKFYTSLIVAALQGATKEELLNSDHFYVPTDLPSDYWTTKSDSPIEPSVLSVIKGSYKCLNPPEIKASGFVVETMEAALWAFYHTNSFEEGALKAVNLGNDADTVGAVYGMLAGAYYGINHIPTEWIDKCTFKDLVQTIADQISIQSQQITMAGEKKVPSCVYRSVLQIYNQLSTFYSRTIKRRVLPCPKQYKSLEQFNDDINQLKAIYDNVINSIEFQTTTRTKYNQR